MVGACDRDVPLGIGFDATTPRPDVTVTDVPLAAELGNARGLVHDLRDPHGVVVDADYMYWFDSSGAPTSLSETLKRVPKAGGEPQVLVTNQRFPRGMVVDDNAVYWFEVYDYPKGALLRVAKTGGEPAALATGLVAPYEMTADTEYLYWIIENSVMRISKIGGSPEVVTETGADINIVGIAVDRRNVYFGTTLTDSVFVALSSGGNAESVLRSGDFDRLASTFGEIAVDETHVYWTRNNLLLRASLATPKASRQSQVLFAGGYSIADLQIVGHRVYFALHDGARWGVHWIDQADGGAHMLIKGPVWSFAVDDTSAYVTIAGELYSSIYAMPTR
jgi:hypothetical protein